SEGNRPGPSGDGAHSVPGHRTWNCRETLMARSRRDLFDTRPGDGPFPGGCRSPGSHTAAGGGLRSVVRSEHAAWRDPIARIFRHRPADAVIPTRAPDRMP